MVELRQSLNGTTVRVIVGTKQECTKSLSKYPNFMESQEVGFGIWKYLYKLEQAEKNVFRMLRNEHVAR